MDSPSAPIAPSIPDAPTTLDLSMYVADILEKQYRNYTWNDGKAYALATLDSFLFAGGFVLYDRLQANVVAAPLLFLAIVLLSVSALTCCRHSIPTLRSGKAGPNDNLRALSCITSFKTWEAYRQAFHEITPEKMLDMTCRQIYGMAHNNTRSHRLLALAARCTMTGVLLLLLALITVQYGDPLIGLLKRSISCSASTTIN